MKWGYRPNGDAFLFDGELPEGWFDTSAVIEDEELRTAEALTARYEAISRGEIELGCSTANVVPIKRRGRPPKVAANG